MFRRWIPIFVFCTLILAVGTVTVGAQSRMQSLAEDSNNSNSLWVTAAAGKEQVRFASLGLVQRMRLEVLNQARDRVYDSDFREGSLLDWKIEDNGGQRLPDGLYGCVVTVEDISGQSIHRQGVFWLRDGEVQFGDPQHNNAVGSTQDEGDYTVTVLRGEEALPITHLAHDGKTGRIVSGKGGLSFRVGDFFSGRDAEHMRLTADGKLGLGIDEPAVKLDVAGLIRTTEGIVFPDGTVQRTAARVGMVGFVGGAPKWFGSTGIQGGGASLTTRANSSGIGDKADRQRKSVLASGRSSDRVLGTEGVNNTFYGDLAGAKSTDYGLNSFFGASAGRENTNGEWNSFFGEGAGVSNTTASWNSFFGEGAGYSNTTAAANSFFGAESGFSNASGYWNAFFGTAAGRSNTEGYYNSFFGTNAGKLNTTGTLDSFFGMEAGYNNTTGWNNAFFGSRAGHSNTTASQNSFIGAQAGFSNTTGGANSFVGYQAGYFNTTGDYNSFVGNGAGFSNTTGGANSFVGYQTGYFNTTGDYNSFVGYQAGYRNTTGQANSFVGYQAGDYNTTGRGNSFVGYQAGLYNTTGYYNSFVGYQAGLHNTTADNNSFVGHQAGYLNTAGKWNSFFGNGAGFSNTTGNWNSFFGNGAGYLNTTGSSNSFFGSGAGLYTTTSNYNSFFGDSAGSSNTSGDSNSFVGYHAGFANTAESNNTFVGASSDGATGITNATAIGYLAKVTRSNSLVLGSINGVNGATANTYVGIGTTNPATELQVISTKSTQPRGISSFQFSNDNLSAIVRAGKARGTATSPSAVQSQDGIFNMQADGYGATGYLYNLGGFQIAAEATFTDSSAPTYWRVLTTPSGTTAPTEKIRITGAGNVGIGTTAPTERLHVVGNIRVTGGITYGAPETDIPDYVFEPDYKLMRIDELEKFIGKEKHLPNMPQASEIKEKGLNLSEFQMKLLEKIEELTLYTVQQAKTIQKQRISIQDHKNALERKDTEVAALNARIAALEQMMERLLRQDNR